MGYDAIHTPHSVKNSRAIQVPVHVDALYLHGPGGSIRYVLSAIPASATANNTAVVVHIIASIENPVIFTRLRITKGRYAGAYVIGK